MKLNAFVFSILLLAGINLLGQEPVIVEAESGTLGSDYEILTDGDVSYIAPKTDYLATSNPGSADKVASYTVTFADSGTYKLYVRMNVGPAGGDDDSFYHGDGFGTKDPTVDADWITVNQQLTSGYTIPYDVVEEQGDAGTEVWKWVCLSDFIGFSAGITFRVELGNLTQTFELGARENGMSIDKFAFGREDLFFTVNNLDKGEAGSVTRPELDTIGTPLADGLDKFLGCGYGSDTKRNFASYWNQITPGNAGKWGSVEYTRDNMVWTELDEAYQLAMDSGFVYKHHVLVWGSQQPSWIETLDSAEQRAELEEWFNAVADRYPSVDIVEVVNEPLPDHNPPDDQHGGNYIGALGGAGETGWDWVIEAFRMARTAFTDTTVLMINDFNIMNSTKNTDEYLGIIKLLQAEDTLIDAIGFQAHGFSHNASNETILRNIDTLASTGLPIYVTELDIDGHTDLEQVHGYMNLFPLLWEHDAIKGITMWGFRPAMWRGSYDKGAAYLIDDFGVERPAMLWLRAYLKGEFVANESVTVLTSTGASTIDTEGGTLQMLAEFTPDTSTLTTANWTVSNTNIATIDSLGVLTAVANGTVTVTATSLELNSDVSDQMDITISGQSSSVENIAGIENVRLYPNPSSDGSFSIDGMESIQIVTILDMSGKLIANYDVINLSELNVDLNVANGLYIVRLFDGAKYYQTKLSVR